MSLTAMLGTPLELEFGGKKYTCSLVTQAVKVAFEKRMHQRAKDAAKELRDLLTQQEYLDHITRLNDDFISGKYSFESPTSLAAVKSLYGCTLLSSIMFGISEDEMMQLLLAAKDEVTNVIHAAFRQSFPGVKEVTDDASSTDEEDKKKE